MERLAAVDGSCSPNCKCCKSVMSGNNCVTDVCRPANECQAFKDEQRELGLLSVGSAEYNQKRKNLVDQICKTDLQDLRVCCPPSDFVVREVFNKGLITLL